MSPDLKQKLKKALAGKAAVEMGQFQFVNLDEIRSQAGDEWPEIRDKTYEVSGHFIEKRLAEDDVIIRCQGGFLIIFSTIGGVEAEAQVEEINEELNEFFLGERWLEKLRSHANARRVPTDEFLSIVARTQVEDEPAEEARPEPEQAQEAAAEAAAGWEKKSGSGEGPKGAKGGRWEKTTQSKSRSDKEGVLDWPDEAYEAKAWDEIIFQPVWDSRTNAVLHHVCQVRRSVGDRHVYGRDTLMGGDEAAALRALDREVALAAQRGFQGVFTKGGKCGITIPVHYETLSAVSHRMEYFSILQAVPKPIRKYFQIRVDSVPSGAPVTQMQEVFRSMRHFGSNILAELGYTGKWDLARFEGCGISVFGASLPQTLSIREPGDEAVMGFMQLVSEAKNLQGEAFLNNIGNPDLLNAAISTGVRLFTGPVIANDEDAPQPARSLDFAGIANRIRNPGPEPDIYKID